MEFIRDPIANFSLLLCYQLHDIQILLQADDMAPEGVSETSGISTLICIIQTQSSCPGLNLSASQALKVSDRVGSWPVFPTFHSYVHDSCNNRIEGDEAEKT